VADVSLEVLRETLEGVASGLSGVTRDRVLGCDGLCAGGSAFAVVWRDGRIGVRLPNEIAWAEAMKMPGSSPLRAGTMSMNEWALVPEALHRDSARLGAWVRRAHALALNAARAGRMPTRPPVRKARPAAPPAEAASPVTRASTARPPAKAKAAARRPSSPAKRPRAKRG
jgi:hypothetical protein